MDKGSLLPFRLKSLRKEKKYTQAYIAEQLNVTVKTYRSWESGELRGTSNEKNYPSTDSEKLIKLAKIYNVSVDYLLGLSDYRSVDKSYIGEITGLSDDAIEMLKILKKYKEESNSLLPALGTDVDVINQILEYEYQKAKKSGDCHLSSWSLFHYIKQYLSSGIFEREQQDRIRARSGNQWFDVEKGDLLTKNNETHKIECSSAINSKSGSGINVKTVNIINTENKNERYVLDINSMFESYSKDNIFRELDKIKKYNRENN